MSGASLVECYVATPTDTTDLHEARWSFALDQRAFGPRRLLVAFGHEDGTFLGLAHTDRTDPPTLALAACIAVFGASDCVAVAYSDEPVAWGPPPPETAATFDAARAVAAEAGVRLVDWMCCDDQVIRSSRIARWPESDPWVDEWIGE